MSTEIADTDLRRALMFYLIGFGIYFSTWLLSLDYLISGLAADPTTSDSNATAQFVYDMLTVASFSVIVLSQLWYLKAKHTLGENQTLGSQLNESRLEVILLLWVAIAILSFLLSTVLTDGVPMFVRFPILSVQLALIVSPVYYLAIVSWNVKRLMGKEESSSLPSVRSLAIGLVSAVLLLPVPYFVSLVVIKTLQSASVVP